MEKLTDELIGFIAFPFVTIFWLIKAIGTFFCGLPSESNRIYGLIRFSVSVFLLLVLSEEQTGYNIPQGNLILYHIQDVFGPNFGKFVFTSIQLFLFVGTFISFLVMIGMSSQNANTAFTHSDVSHGDEYPRLNRMLKNLDAQFTSGSRSNDLMAYLKKNLFNK